jgi:hypothetical protein
MAACIDCARHATCSSLGGARGTACSCKIAGCKCTTCNCYKQCRNKRPPLPASASAAQSANSGSLTNSFPRVPSAWLPRPLRGLLLEATPPDHLERHSCPRSRGLSEPKTRLAGDVPELVPRGTADATDPIELTEPEPATMAAAVPPNPLPAAPAGAAEAPPHPHADGGGGRAGGRLGCRLGRLPAF